MRVDKYLGRALPEEVTAGDISNMIHLLTYWNLMVNNFNLSKAYNSGKYKHVLNLFDGRKRSSDGVKWSTLSIREGDIYSAMNDLNISSSRCIEEMWRRGTTDALNCASEVPFASSLIFELHQEEESYQVKVRFNGRYINLCERAS